MNNELKNILGELKNGSPTSIRFTDEDMFYIKDSINMLSQFMGISKKFNIADFLRYSIRCTWCDLKQTLDKKE